MFELVIQDYQNFARCPHKSKPAADNSVLSKPLSKTAGILNYNIAS